MIKNFTLRYAHANEIHNWDLYVLQNKRNAGFLQSKAYADTKKLSGWNIRYIAYESKDETIYGYFLEKKLSALGYLWYIPSSSLPLNRLESLLQANKEFILHHRLPVFAIKIEPSIPETPLTRLRLTELKLHRSAPIQAHNSTIILDLQKSEHLLNELAPKARRDIRLAQKQSIKVQKVPFTASACETMYALMKTVSRGKGSAYIRPYDYYRAFWHNFSLDGKGSFYFAYEGERAVVGAFIIHYGDTTTYKDGGSRPDTAYNKRYSIAIQWQALQDAKKRGALYYDLCGVPDRSNLHNPAHPYFGIGQFKLKFKKETVDYCGCYDQVLQPFSYTVWIKLQRIIYKLHWIKHHDLYF